MKLNENQQTNVTLYHATYQPLIPSIRQHGLGAVESEYKWSLIRDLPH